MPEVFTVLYVCVHNAGRSQMAEAVTNHRAQERNLPVRAFSAGTFSVENINPLARTALEEIAIPTEGLRPKQLTQAMANAADRIITMGCGVNADVCPARFLVSEDWGLDDPAGQPLETVRLIRDEIQHRVKLLLAEFEATR